MTEAGGHQELVIDQLAHAAAEMQHAPLLPGRQGESWQRLTNGLAWAQSGAVASWLIAQGYGPEGRVLAVPEDDTPGHAVVRLGALRAGALVVEGPCPVEVAVLLRCPIDAAVAERRRHIDAGTPARRCGARLHRHGDFETIAEAVASASRA